MRKRIDRFYFFLIVWSIHHLSPRGRANMKEELRIIIANTEE